ncbi:tripartite tricarboxylate transporter permease [Aquibaculum arenosum]|uniref:Tripartite tricarboxylate transporter permease n=1 Tax=Aquibaculum arenosum TaxID=3032591 RepID=A0ABT5YQ34_9PROT|nr:tripartite tricarboxylate transporter permease [Fodinicurvata sp. CAU 1616]MDF2096957.1 tripartite tricarboxylate transporter permease [Fodinicurvata sp. CAU 1616]
MDPISQAFDLVLQWQVVGAVVAAAIFGLLVGAIPGLTATMATALLVPFAFFMDPVPAVGMMVTCAAMAIFAGDIPGTLLRIPGTPASAAYAGEGYAMTLRGQAELALGANLLYSALGGLFGTAVLIFAAPTLAEIALNFSSVEYFWMALLGLTCAVFIGASSPLKGLISLFIGLFVATIGLNNPAGVPRFTFGSSDLLAGIDFIPAMIGLFAVSTVLSTVAAGAPAWEVAQKGMGNIFRSWGTLLRTYWRQQLRGNVLGTTIGALPGAGADIAAWVAYAISRRFSRQPEKYGTGHVEGIVEATSANNAAVSSAWIPAFVFGIPGDTITAIVIGVLYVKGLNPGPTLFLFNPQTIYAVFLIFILANLVMIPLGWLVIKLTKRLLQAPRRILMPLILAFCMVGAYASNNSVYGIVVMLVFGVLGFFMEENDIPIAPCILGIVLGPLLEDRFISAMIRGDGSLLFFFERPIAAGLGVVVLSIWAFSLIGWLRRRRKLAQAPAG